MASSLTNIGRCAALLILLSGCAAQMAYRDGNDLIAKNQVEAGLAKYQEAVQAEPLNAQYRSAYLSARERAMQRILDVAERDQAEGRAAQAEQVQVMASGLDHPWSLAFLPAGDVLVTERAGRLWRLGTGGQKRAIAGVPAVRLASQGGLFDVVLHPKFADNGLIYLSYAAGLKRNRQDCWLPAVRAWP